MYKFTQYILPYFCVASASGGGEASRPRCSGPLTAPAGPHSPKDQRGGAVVPTEGLHTAWPRAPAQERRRVHWGHPHTDRQRAWWVCKDFLVHSSSFTLAYFCEFTVDSFLFCGSIFSFSVACVGVVLLQIPVSPVVCEGGQCAASLWGRVVLFTESSH